MLNICYNIYKERQQEQKKGRRVNIQAIKRTKKDNRMDDNRKIENFMQQNMLRIVRQNVVPEVAFPKKWNNGLTNKE